MKIRKFTPKIRFPHPSEWFPLIINKLKDWKTIVFNGIASGHNQYLVTLAIVVGSVAGFTAYLFHIVIDFVSHKTIGDLVSQNAFGTGGKAWLLFYPALGGLVVGGIMLLVRKEDRQQGVPEVIHSLMRRGGRMSIKSTFLKSWGAIFTIGSGGVCWSRGTHC